MIQRVVAIGDMHCGHRAGIAPPPWHVAEERWPKVSALQREMWQRYTALARKIQRARPVHAVILNGDLIDGRGERSGGTELLTTDRQEQCDMAVHVARQWRPRAGFVQTYGTPYHTGQCEDYERYIAEDLGSEIHSHVWPEVGGVVFDVKHEVGSSGIPHGRSTALGRANLWNMLWAEHDRQPRGQVLLRSHVHYHQYTGGPGWLAMTLPALQAAATKYGARRCEGLVHWGVTWFDIDTKAKEIVEWKSETVILQAEKSTVLKL